MTVTSTTLRPLLVREAMSTPAISVAPSASVSAAWSLMLTTGLRHLVVVEDGLCMGLVDDRSVFAQWPMGPLALRRKQVRNLIRASTAAVLPDDDVQTAAAVMMRDGVDAVPVVDTDGVVLGIVTGGDIACAVAAHGICVS